MGLFGKPKTPAPPKAVAPEPSRSEPGSFPTPSASPADTTVVARGSAVEGRITGEAGVRIEGRLEGGVESGGVVVIAGGGVVRGDVHGKLVTVAGSVEGDLSATERVELAPSGRLSGNITAPRVHIAEGATFEGQVFMRKGAPREPDRVPGPSDAVPKDRDPAPAGGRRSARRSGRGS